MAHSQGIFLFTDIDVHSTNVMLSDCRERHLNDGLNAAVEDGGAKLPDARVQLGHHHPHPLLTVTLSLLDLVDNLNATEGEDVW